jgi:indoleamine 2,3-dioxygenase
LGDNLLEITASFPENELTAVLREFRQYRPPTQREYIQSVETRARLAKIRAYSHADPKTLALYVLNVDQVYFSHLLKKCWSVFIDCYPYSQIREFRNRHWSFTKEYIIRRSSYGIATGMSSFNQNKFRDGCLTLPGGSPILRYLPNNLSTVNTVLEEACKALPGNSALTSAGLSECLINAVDACRKRAEVQRRVLDAEMAVWDIVSDQKKHEMERVGVSRAANSEDLGEQKIMQRGWVGNDGVG